MEYWFNLDALYGIWIFVIIYNIKSSLPREKLNFWDLNSSSILTFSFCTWFSCSMSAVKVLSDYKPSHRILKALTKSSNFVTWEALWLSYANFKGPAVKISFDFLNFLKFAITTLILWVEVFTVQRYFHSRLSIFFKYYIVNISIPETILNQLLFTVS